MTLVRRFPANIAVATVSLGRVTLQPRDMNGMTGDLNRATMHIITRKRLNEFVDKHPAARPGLIHWYQALNSSAVASFSGLRMLFPSADQVGKLTVFNIGGNTARLIAAIHYNRQKVYIRAVLTHEEYDESKWKE